MLAETSTKDLSEQEKPEGMSENVAVARRGGKIAGIARDALESELGKTVISQENAAQINAVITKTIEDVVTDNEEK